MSERRKTKERRKSVREVLEAHSKEDHKNFKNIGDTLKRIEGHMKTSNDFMESLNWLSDISKGTQLLKKPSLWIVGFVITAVALLGGVKALAAFIISWIMPK